MCRNGVISYIVCLCHHNVVCFVSQDVDEGKIERLEALCNPNTSLQLDTTEATKAVAILAQLKETKKPTSNREMVLK